MLQRMFSPQKSVALMPGFLQHSLLEEHICLDLLQSARLNSQGQSQRCLLFLQRCMLPMQLVINRTLQMLCMAYGVPAEAMQAATHHV